MNAWLWHFLVWYLLFHYAPGRVDRDEAERHASHAIATEQVTNALVSITHWHNQGVSCNRVYQSNGKMRISCYWNTQPSFGN